MLSNRVGARYIFSIILIFILSFSLITVGCSRKLTAEKIYSLNKNSVGKISTNKGNGSAVVIDKEKGLLITNHHVLSGVNEISYITEFGDNL